MAQTYWGKEVAKTLGIGDSSLRKICLALEKAGYCFERGTNKSRVFYSKDVLLLERLVAAMNEQGRTIEQAVSLAMMHDEDEDRTTDVLAIPKDTEQSEGIIERLERLESQNRELLQGMLELQKLFVEREAQRDAQLMQLIEERQKTEQLVAATEQLVAAAEQERSKGSLWARLFRKGNP